MTLGSLKDFAVQMDWWGLVALLITVVASLLCITLHELSHGLVAYRLGDPTAKVAGRLTLNPLKHLDIFGLVMMLVVKVGWAKAVPVDMRNFKNPRRDMAITALAGPISNFLVAIIACGGCSLINRLAPMTHATLIALSFFANLALLSVGLGLFNLIPISPLDGSKVLFALLPDKAYYTILRYERYVMGLVVVLTMLGVFQKPLSFLMVNVLRGFCAVTGMDLGALIAATDVAYILRMF